MTTHDTLSSLQRVIEPRHDTIYCNPTDADKLASSISGNSFGGNVNTDYDTFRVLGLDVEVMSQIDAPIVCEKGEVFTLAEDFKG